MAGRTHWGPLRGIARPWAKHRRRCLWNQRWWRLGPRQLPSGKPAKNDGQSPVLISKSTISMAIFNRFLYVYQRVSGVSMFLHGFHQLAPVPDTRWFWKKSGRCDALLPQDINQIFDILPIMGTLEPGHTQDRQIGTQKSMGYLQDPKMEVLYHIRPYFLEIFPYIFWGYSLTEKKQSGDVYISCKARSDF